MSCMPLQSTWPLLLLVLYDIVYHHFVRSKLQVALINDRFNLLFQTTGSSRVLRSHCQPKFQVTFRHEYHAPD